MENQPVRSSDKRHSSHPRPRRRPPYPRRPPARRGPEGPEDRSRGDIGTGEQRVSHPSTLAPIVEAQNEVEQIRIKLEEVLEDMERVLEILNRAEIEKSATEHEIQSLQRSLRSLHRPGPRPPASAAPDLPADENMA